MDKGILHPRGVDSARVIQVIETKSARGSGTGEQPARLVTEYWALDGKKLAERDPGVSPIVASGVDRSERDAARLKRIREIYK